MIHTISLLTLLIISVGISFTQDALSTYITLNTYYESCVSFLGCREQFVFYDHSLKTLLNGASYERNYRDFTRAIQYLESRRGVRLDHLNETLASAGGMETLAYELSAKFPKDQQCNNDQRLVYDIRHQRMSCQCKEGNLCTTSDTTFDWLILSSLWLLTAVGFAVFLCMTGLYIYERNNSHRMITGKNGSPLQKSDYMKTVVALGVREQRY